jgi:tripartite-type tricarboxylate transporter receptor subunit TctC
MKKAMKKHYAGILLLVLMVVLAGCSSGKTNTDEGGSEASASEWPTGTIEVIVPAGAGGDTDRNTRTIAKYLEKELDTSFVVSNVNGAGGTTGSKKVLDAEPDGNTVLSFHNSILISNILEMADYNHKGFEVAGLGIMDKGNAFIVNSKSQFKDLKDLVEYAKENPGKINVATEVGAFTHLQLLALQEETGAEFNIVDVGGASDKIAALLGGQIDVIPNQIGLVNEYIESGDFRALGVFADERMESAPDVPTFKEQGYDITFEKLYFWAFPPETPKEIVNKFSKALEKVVANEEFQREAEGFMVEGVYLSPEDTTKRLDEAAKYYEELYSKQ